MRDLQVRGVSALVSGLVVGCCCMGGGPPSGAAESRPATSRPATEFVGLGIQFEPTADGLRINRVFRDVAAAQAGIHDGEVITTIDGRSAQGMSVDDATGLLRGAEGTSVTLGLRAADGTSRTLTVTRSRVVVTGVEHEMLAGRVGFVRIERFTEKSSDTLRQALVALSAAKAEALVVDLRGNSGGLYDQIVACAGLLISKGQTLWYVRPIGGTPQPEKAKGGPASDLPLVVLIDAQTAGGELIAAAVKQTGRGKVIGQKSSGLVAGKQLVKPHPDQDPTYAITHEYLVNERDLITGQGVEPDVALADDTPPQQALERAIELLRVPSGRVAAPTDPVYFTHDPTIAEADGTYYVFSTGPGIPIRRSKDLVHWEHAGRVFKDDVPGWAAKTVPGAKDVWAPDIAFFNGTYWLYYSVSTFGSQRSVIGLATNLTLDPDRRDYQWTDQGLVLDSQPGQGDFNAIDPAFVLDEAQQPWLAFGSYWGGIKLVGLDAPTGKPRPGGNLRALAARPGSTAIEASYLIHRDGFYYLFVSFDRCCKGVDSDYKIMVGRSQEITGPYADSTGRPMTEGGGTLLLASHANWRGPGHNAVLRTLGQDWLVHHTYDAEQAGTPRLQVRPLVWLKDGWPVAGEPLCAWPPSRRTPLSSELVGAWTHGVQYGPGSVIRLLPDGKINDGPGGATWSLEGRALTLRWPNAQAPGGFWIDDCVVAPDGRSYIGRNQNGTVIRGMSATDPQGAPTSRP
jgi:arabinan endo-1,5-alpha-L-arabinosidase